MHNPQTPPGGGKPRRGTTTPWWQDWAGWADARADRLIPPPPTGSDRYPALGAAPGDYVRCCAHPIVNAQVAE